MTSLFFLALLVGHPLPAHEALEPSVQNEVDHALALVPPRPTETNEAVLAVHRAFTHVYATNGMNATARAIDLVSRQRDGEWFFMGTNVTAAAVQLLSSD